MNDRAIVPLLAISMFAVTPAAAQGCHATRSIQVTKGADGAEAGDIGLSVALNRGEPVYAVGESLVLTIRVKRAATIEIWELDPAGSLSRIISGVPATARAPLVLPSGRQRFTIAPPLGMSELRVVARAAPAGSTRGIGNAESRLSQRALRQEVRLCYRIVPR